MTGKNPEFSKIILAVLPVLPQLVRFHDALLIGLLIAISFWITDFFFSLTRFVFPQKLQGLALGVWMMTLAQGGWVWGQLPPMWVASIFLLEPAADPGGGRPGKEKFFRGLGFWMLTGYLGIFQDILGQKFHAAAFFTPGGSFLLLAFAAILWQNKLEK